MRRIKCLITYLMYYLSSLFFLTLFYQVASDAIMFLNHNSVTIYNGTTKTRDCVRMLNKYTIFSLSLWCVEGEINCFFIFLHNAHSNIKK